MVEILILYLLNRHNLTIYKLERAIAELFAPFAKPSLGSIAPALNKLAGAGFVNYDEKFSQGGLKSKTYSVTASGLAQLKKMLVNFKFKGLNTVQKTASALLFCLDILNDDERSALLKNIENNLRIYKAEVEKELKNPYIRLDEVQTAILNHEVMQVNSLLALVGGLG